MIHVAGTKGKGSTCAFADSILRAHGLRTGLYTSPHLISVRERIRLDGVLVSELDFTLAFFACWRRLRQTLLEAPAIPAVTYFKFLTVLAFDVFIRKNVQVAVVEVGIGGRYDATNFIDTPVVCGISSLGFDHLAILGRTLPEIAYQKAGIIKPRVPVVSVPQEAEAMSVIESCARECGSTLRVTDTWDIAPSDVKDARLGLQGEHQKGNAMLALQLCRTWLRDKFDLQLAIKGLELCRWPGRAQVIPWNQDLTYYFDGAHTPESIRVSIWTIIF